MPAQSFTRAELLAAPSAFVHSLTVRFQDIDAAGILFFARVFEYLHDAYVALLAHAGSPLPQTLAERAFIAPLVHAEADFLYPLRFGDSVAVHVVAARRSEGAYALGYRLESNGRPVALGQTVHVPVDPATFLRIPLPEPLARTLALVTR